MKLFSSMESMILNLDFNIEEEELKQMERRKTKMQDLKLGPKPETIRWRFELEQRNYSTKLVEALCQVRCNSSSLPSSAKLSSSPPKDDTARSEMWQIEFSPYRPKEKPSGARRF